MLTVYELQLLIDPDDLLKTIGFLDGESWCTSSLLVTDKTWSIASRHLTLSGGFKDRRFKITGLDVLSEVGLEAAKELALTYRGTLIAVWEDGWQAIYITKGQEASVSILELYDRHTP